MTRIISGSRGGRRIAVPPVGTRPTSDRVREAMFSSLDSQFVWSGLHVLDLYSGSGALGIEALSRGASHALFIENDARATAIIRKNLVDLGFSSTVVEANVATIARTAPPAGIPGSSAPYDLVFIDPPYDLPASDIQTALTGLTNRGWFADDVLAVVERSTRDLESPWPQGWSEVRRKAYGETTLWYGHIDSDG